MILHPALSTNAPLHFTFQQGTISSLQSHYEAISYTWGEPNLIFPLQVDDGTRVMVTENLDRALRRLRYTDRDRVLWADAACINQADDREKERQIPLMVEIFREAAKVIAWLDPGGDTAREQRGMRILDRMSRKRIGGYSYKDWPLQREAQDISRFLALPWFNRLWIVQEIVFNTEVRLICGETKLPWTRFVCALSYLDSLPKNGGLDSDSDPDSDPNSSHLSIYEFHPRQWQTMTAISKIQKLWSYHSLLGRSMQSMPDTKVAQLVEDFAMFRCTDPRDRIFAVYSMASHIRPTNHVEQKVLGIVYMNIDYSLDVRQTYEAFALATIKSHRPTSIMNALLARQHSLRPEDWPSWVPDWRVIPQGLRDNTLGTTAVSFQNLYEVPPHIVPLEFRRLNGPQLTVKTVHPPAARKALGYADVGHDTLLSVLLQICTNPVREAHNMRFPNLFDLMASMLDGKDERKSVRRLEDRFWELTKSPLERHPENPALIDVEESINELERAFDHVTFFSFDAPYSQRQIAGLSNTALEVGDELFPLNLDDVSNRGKIRWEYLVTVLILRPVGSLRVPLGGALQPVYRLIGHGWTDGEVDSLGKVDVFGRPKKIRRVTLHLG